MQSKTFSRISTVVVVLTSILVLFWLSSKAVNTTPFPTIEDLVASTTEPIASSSMPIPSHHTDISTTNDDVIQDEDRIFTDIKAPNGKIHSVISSTNLERELGLGYRSSIASNQGMLFVFANPSRYDFWMKDMKFPIDIVWIRADKSVAGVIEDLSPDTYPKIFSPNEDIKYVLELNSGGASVYGIATSTKLVF